MAASAAGYKPNLAGGNSYIRPDRNLYVNGATFNGISTRPATAALDTAGTAHFTIRPIAVPLAASMTGAAPNATSAMHLIMPTLVGS